jgi:hypothetical protein
VTEQMPNGLPLCIVGVALWLCAGAAVAVAAEAGSAAPDLIAVAADAPDIVREPLAPKTLAATDAAGVAMPEAAAFIATSDVNGGGVFDEVRFGAGLFVKSDIPDSEDGVFPGGEILLDPFVARFENAFANVLLRPRPHFGAALAAGDGTSLLYAGLTWNVPLPSVLFLEAAFGGAVHEGELDPAPGENKLDLGCRVVFRESIGIGAAFGHWRLITAVDHASNGGLCDGNDGLTHATASVGYRF